MKPDLSLSRTTDSLMGEYGGISAIVYLFCAGNLIFDDELNACVAFRVPILADAASSTEYIY